MDTNQTPTSPQPCQQCVSCKTWTNLNKSEEFCDTCLGDQRKIDGCYAVLRARVEELEQHNKALREVVPARLVDLEKQLATVTQDRDELKYRLQVWNDIAAEQKHE